MVMHSINPATEEVVESFQEFSPQDVERVLQQSHDASRAWRTTSFGERSARLQAVARILRTQKATWAELITREMGKPIVEAEAEVEKCAWNCDFYAEHAPRFLADERYETGAQESFVAFEPLGVVLAIMPWNFPFWQVLRFAAPALMAGNGAVLKHASNVPGCALAIEQIIRQAGLPEGLFRTLMLPGSAIASVIADPRISAVTLTGSSEVGENVASLAGKHIKKQVLELGGSDPFIVLDDADIDAAAKVAARARNQNSGQSCIAAKRFIVETGVAEEFTQKFAAAVQALQVGDPFERSTNVGPLARGDLRETLQRQVEESLARGAHAVTGGGPIDRKGYYYAPTVLDEVSLEMPAFREEMFGPVAAVVPAQGRRRGRDRSPTTPSTGWARTCGRATSSARRAWLAGSRPAASSSTAWSTSDPRLPFGGVKRSGYGRELSHYGIREFTNIQTIVVGATVPPKAQSTASE